MSIFIIETIYINCMHKKCEYFLQCMPDVLGSQFMVTSAFLGNYGLNFSLLVEVEAKKTRQFLGFCKVQNYNLQILIEEFSHRIFVLLVHSLSNFQASQDKKSLDVGANLFVGNLDPVQVFSQPLYIHLIVKLISFL